MKSVGPKYDASVRAFAEAIRRVDPMAKVLSSFPSADTLREGGGYLDYLCPHHYDCGDLWGKEAELKFLQDQIARYGAGRNVRVAVTEWNTTAGEMGTDARHAPDPGERPELLAVSEPVAALRGSGRNRHPIEPGGQLWLRGSPAGAGLALSCTHVLFAEAVHAGGRFLPAANRADHFAAVVSPGA